MLAAAAVNTIYMYGFFGWDKVIGPMLGRPTYFRFIEVRSYYSETLILLAAPIGILARTLWFPPEGLAASHGRKLGQRTIVLLIVYLFAFLSITLSKAALLAFGLAVWSRSPSGSQLLDAVRRPARRLTRWPRYASWPSIPRRCFPGLHSDSPRIPVID